MEWTSPSGIRKKKGAPLPPPPPRTTVPQARLDAISTPSPAYYRAYVRWWVRLNTETEAYPAAALLERVYALLPEILALEAQVAEPPEAWSAAEWQAAHEKTRKLRGQQRAIEETLERRERLTRIGLPLNPREWPTLRHGSKPSTSTPDEVPDPFREP